MKKWIILLSGLMLSLPLSMGCDDTTERKIEVKTSTPEGTERTKIEKKTEVESDGDTKTTIKKETDRD